MKSAARVLLVFVLLTLTAGLLTACAAGPLRKRLMETERPSQTQATDSIMFEVTDSPTNTPPVDDQQDEMGTSQTAQYPSPQPDETIPSAAPAQENTPEDSGASLENLLDDLVNANTAGDNLDGMDE